MHRTAAGDEAIAPRQAVVLAPGQVHAYEKPVDLEVINIYYLSEWLLDDLRPLMEAEGLVARFLAFPLLPGFAALPATAFVIPEPDFDAIRHDLKDIDRELLAGRPSMLLVRGTFLRVLVRLARAAGATSERPFPPHVRRMIDDFEQILTGRESTCPRSDAPAISKGHAAKLFRRSTGVSPREYFQRRRVVAAAHLLLQTSLSITDIAMFLRFTDAAHFSRRFHEHYGCSPRAYRTTYRQQPAA